MVAGPHSPSPLGLECPTVKLSDGEHRQLNPTRWRSAVVWAAVLSAGCMCGEAPAVMEPEALVVECPVRAFDVDGRREGAWLEAVFEAFEDAFDASRYDEALVCAQTAARHLPGDAGVHVERGVALDALGRTHDAHLAFGRAHALAPQDPEVALAYADFLERDGSNDALETALVLAADGREASRDPELSAELALVEARAANSLGLSSRALVAAETAFALDEREEALLERGIALFELTEVAQADRALSRAAERLPTNPRAAHWAGLVAEHLGREAEAAKLFEKAERLDPLGYPAPLVVSSDEFKRVVDREIAALPLPLRTRLQEEARLKSEDLPSVEDLRDATGVVLSPTILGLFVPGPPAGKSDIVLYRKNILRLSRDRNELERQVRDTLLHELGHVAGETDEELRDRGL